MGWIRTLFKNKRTGEIMANRGYIIYLLDGTTLECSTDSEGFVYIKDLKIGEYFISFKD